MPEASASAKPATKFNWLQIAQLLRTNDSLAGAGAMLVKIRREGL